MKSNIQHIFFDLDHTLWDFDKNSLLAFQMLFDKFEVAIDIDDFLNIYQPINMNYWKLYREERVSKTDLRRGRLIETFKSFKMSFSINIIDQMSDDYIDFLPLNNYLIDGAKDLLDYLRPSYKLHIITNGFREVQNRKLVSSGIYEYFVTVTNSEDAGVKKPNPRIFEQALQKSGAQLANSIMIGDNYEADIMGAEAMGLETIFFNYHGEVLPIEYPQVSKLKQIKTML
ncbi:YjjG family noncanonical pyrimidine nucleotidase [Aquimarina pacifica]|uniref:YjjG family noncanonical pyrimidine nucleotidase n=1 Tax=Aquimarina pacifica TaxID=1296415 RepID=UPI0004729B9C|nr:YjjG family noncanonical pyrimidine nucleotidase [Aquimarina pacifica]